METIHNILTSLTQWALDLILPHSCALCNSPNEALCRACRDQLLIPHAQCAICRARNQYGSMCSGRCRMMLPQGPTYILWAANYQTIRSAISSFKYRKRAELAEPLGIMLSQKIQNVGKKYSADTTVIVAIPMHPKKERERGYNQADLLAEILARELKVPYVRNALKKRVYKEAQALQESKQGRLTNIRDSFELTSSGSDIAGKTIILVDDVVTTGATMTAASQILRMQNPKRIIGIAIAH